jgi:ABC-type uncharacterized transport system ATPase subunit
VEEVCDEVLILKDGLVVHQADLEAERRANRRFVQLEVTGDDRAFGDTIREVGGEGISDAPGQWRIVLPHGVEIGVLWRLAARHQLRVRRMTHRRDTLEEIFLKAVGHIGKTPAERPAEVTAHGRL